MFFSLLFPRLCADWKSRSYVVTSFSILKDFTDRVLGKQKYIEVFSLIPANQDPHHFLPTPEQMKKLSCAKLLITNGLGFEHWVSRLSGVNCKIIEASAGVNVLKTESNYDDPHAWLCVSNAKIYAKNIADALINEYPDLKEQILENLFLYFTELDELDNYIKQKIENANVKNIVTTHNAFNYFGNEYGLNFFAPKHFGSCEHHTPQIIADLIKLIRDKDVTKVYLEGVSDQKLMKQIRKETNAQNGGTLYADALPRHIKNYIKLMKHNVDLIANN